MDDEARTKHKRGRKQDMADAHKKDRYAAQNKQNDI